jgi:hypothetical protein
MGLDYVGYKLESNQFEYYISYNDQYRYRQTDLYIYIDYNSVYYTLTQPYYVFFILDEFENTLCFVYETQLRAGQLLKHK